MKHILKNDHPNLLSWQVLSEWLPGFLVLLCVLMLTACGGGSSDSGTDSGANGYEIQITQHDKDNDNLGGELRKAESISVAVFEENTDIRDNCTYLSDDRQSFESDPFTWTVTPADMATLSATTACSVSLVANKAGDFTLTASNRARTVTRTIQVDPALLTAIAVVPDDGAVYKGLTQDFQATGHYSDGTTVDLTDQVTWATEFLNPADQILAEFDAQIAGRLTGLNDGTMNIFASLDDDLASTVTGTVPFEITPSAVVSIALDDTLAAPLGRELDLAASASFTDDTIENLATTVTWVIADDTLVSVDDSGHFTALQEGTTELYATRDNNYGTLITSNTLSITVEPRLLDSLALTPLNDEVDSDNPVIAIDKEEAFSITGTYSTGEVEDFTGDSDVTLASSDETVATFSLANSQALVETLTVGTTALTATRLNRRSETVVGTLGLEVNHPTLVSIDITNPLQDGENFAQGDSITLGATGHYADGSTREISSHAQIEWESATPGVVDFLNGVTSPLLSAVQVGAGQVTANMVNEEDQRITSNALDFTVVLPVVRSVRIDSASDGLSSENTLSLPQGLEHTLQLIGIFSDNSESVLAGVSWTGSDETLATINDAGTVTATKTAGQLGDLTVAAAFEANGIHYNAQITTTVTAPILTNLAVELDGESGFWKGRQQDFNAIGTFSNDDEQVLTDQVSWTIRTDDANRVTQLTNAYQLTLDQEGAVQLSATYTDSANSDQTTTTSFSFTVQPALLDQILVEANNQFGLAVTDVPSGKQQQFTATGTYSDGTTEVLTSQTDWTSSLPAYLSIVASGDQAGLATGEQPTSDTDVLTVSASLGNAAGADVVGSLPFAVAPAELISTYLQLPTDNVYDGNIPLGASEALELIGTYSDGLDRSIDASLAIWSSDDSNNATVGELTGVVTAVAGQTTPVSVTIRAIEQRSGKLLEASYSVQTAAAIFESIRIDPDTTESAWLVAEGGQRQFRAYAVFTDDSEQEITSDTAVGDVTETLWSIPDTAQATVVSVDNRAGFKGLVTGIQDAAQENTLTVSKENSRGWDIESSARIVVGGAVLAAVEIVPASVDLVTGDSLALVANGIYSNNTQADLSSEVHWSSQRLDVVQFNSVQPSLAEAMGVGTSLISATYPAQNGEEEVVGYRQINVETKALRSLAVTPTVSRTSTTPDTRALFLLGLGDQLTATGTYSDRTTSNLSAEVTWVSDRTDIVTVSSTGLLVPVAVGDALITAEQDIVELGVATTIRIEYPVRVGSALLQSIELEPQSPTIPDSTRKAFSAYGRYSDGTRADVTQQVDWQTGFLVGEDPAVKVGVITDAVDGSGGGIFTAQREGQISVSARLINQDADTIAASTITTVTGLTGLELTLDQTAFYQGQSATLTAYGLLSDGTRAVFDDGVNWTLQTPATLTMDALSDTSELTINAIASGQAQIDASRTLIDGTVLTASWTFTIQGPLLDRITTDIDVNAVPKGMTRQLTATGHYSDNSTTDLTTSVTWSSSSTALATVDSSGVVTGHSEGQLRLVASQTNAESQDIESDALAFTVDAKTLKALAVVPSTLGVALGRQQQFLVTGTYSDDSLEPNVTSGLVWQSSDTTVATVDASGLVTTLSQGQAAIEARLPAALTDASGAVDIWSTASLTVNTPVLNQISLGNLPASLADGQSQQLEVNGILSDGTSAGLLGTSSVSWFSSNSSVASVSTQGLLTAKEAGQARVQISTILDNGVQVTDEAVVVVTEKVLERIHFSPSTLSLAGGQQSQLTAIGTYSDGSIISPLEQGFVWTSADSSLAAISPTGLVTAKSVSANTDVDITAASITTGVSVTPAVVTVQPAVLDQLFIDGNGSSVPVGQTATFTVTGLDSLGNAMTATEVGTVQWSSSDTTLATLDAGTGVLTARNTGRVTIMASQLVGDVTVFGEAEILLGDAVLTEIDISADDGSAAATVGVGMQHPFSATGVYSDGSRISNLDTGFSWSLTGATGSAAGVIDTDGLLTLSAGAVSNTIQVTALPSSSSVSVTQTATVTVAAAELISLTIPDNGTVVPVCQLTRTECSSAGLSQTLTVTGLNSDGQEATGITGVSWSVSDSRLATIDASSGEVIGLVAGAVEVTAEVLVGTRQVVATATVLVGDEELTAINVLSAAGQSSIEVGLGLQHPLTVQGTYSNQVEVDDLGGIQWQVSSTEPTNQASVSVDGVLTLSAGVAGTTLTVTATHSETGLTDTVSVTVTAAEIISLTLLEATSSLPLSTQQTLTLVMQDSLGQLCRVTNVGTSTACTASQQADLSWSVSDTRIASVDQNGELLGLNQGTVQLHVQQLSGPAYDRRVLTAEALVVVEGPALTTITVSPSAIDLPSGMYYQMAAIGTYSDGSVVSPLEQGFVWTSADSSLAAISPTGLVTAKSVSANTDVDITAASITTGVSVTPAVVTVQPAVLDQLFIDGNGSSVPVGQTATFTVTGLDSLGNAMTATEVGTVQWSSSDTTLATLDAGTGVLTARNTGRVTIMASQLVGDVTVFGEAEILLGDAVLTEIDISADDGSAAATVGVGMQHPFSATGVYSDGSRISNLDTGFSWSLTGATGSAAGVIDTDGLLTLSAGAVSNTIQVTALPSSSSVSVTQTATVTVAAAELISLTIPDNGTVVPVCQLTRTECSSAGLSQTLTVTGLNSDGQEATGITGVSWSVSDSRLATIDASSGEVIGLVAGAVEVTAEVLVGTRQVVATATVLVGDEELTDITIQSAVQQSTLEVAIGLQHPLQVIGAYSNQVDVSALTDIEWQVSSTNASNQASVNAEGILTLFAGVSGSTLTVTATHSDTGLTDSVSVTVTDTEIISLAIKESSSVMALSTTQTLTLSLQDSLGQNCLVTNIGSSTACTATQISGLSWSVSDSRIASIDQNGDITALNEGVVEVQAHLVGGASFDQSVLAATATVVVGDAELTSVSLTPSLTSVAAGTQQSMAVTGTFSNGVSMTLDQADFTWSVSQLPTGAAVTVTPTGLIQVTQGPNAGVADPNVEISAVYRADTTISSTQTFTVGDAQLAGMTIDQAGSSVPVGDALSLTASGTDSQGQTATSAMLSGVSWSVSDTTIARIDSSTGVLTGVSEGQVTVFVEQDLGSVGLVTAQAQLLVGAAEVTSIGIDTPSQTAVAEGLQLQLEATVVYGNGVELPVTDGLSWDIASEPASSDIVISSTGLLTVNSSACAGQAGCELTVEVTHSDSGAISTAQSLTVADTEIVSLTIQEHGEVVAVGATLDMTALGQTATGASATLTNADVVWSVSDVSLATVDQTGQLSSLATGSVTVQISKVEGLNTSPRTVIAEAVVILGSATVTDYTVTTSGGADAVSLAVSDEQDFAVEATYSDGQTVADVSSGYSWTTEAITGVTAPTVAITAEGAVTVQSGNVGDQTRITVLPDDASVTVQPATLTVSN